MTKNRYCEVESNSICVGTPESYVWWAGVTLKRFAITMCKLSPSNSVPKLLDGKAYSQSFGFFRLDRKNSQNVIKSSF